MTRSRKGPSQRNLAIAAAVLALAGLAVVFLLVMPANRDKQDRARVDAAMAVSAEYERAVERYFALNKRLPSRLGEIGMAAPVSPAIASFSFDGGIHVEPAGVAPAGRVSLRPIAAGAAVTWSCSAQGLRAEVLPAACK